MLTNQGVLGNAANVRLKRRVPTAVKKLYWTSQSHYSNLRKMYRLARPLRQFLKNRVTLKQAEEEVKKALENREQRFLELIQLQVYQNPSSPYLKLLKHAGCEFSDLRDEILRNGLDETLKRLASEGVYLSAEEFRGKKELRRGTLSLRVSPEDFEAPVSSGFGVQSGGTAGRPVLALLTLDHLAVRAYSIAVSLAAHDLFSCSHAVYEAILPSGTGGIQYLLSYAKLGIVTDRWFARVIPGAESHGTPYDHLTTYLMVGLGRLFGPGFPKPEFVDIQDVRPIVLWADEQRRQNKRCSIRAASSNVARIARAAWEMGIPLDNMTFNSGGEPVTEAKRQLVERVGGRIIPRYSFTPGGPVGHGCANPLYTDEVHVNQYMLAVIERLEILDGYIPPIRPLLFTSLYPSSSHLLLNVANGDYATAERRNCGCGLERTGLTLHLHDIRSYEKLTSEGMNYLYTDLYELVERVLPTEFGGAVGDYQLVEEEDGSGQTRISVLVHPEIGEVNEELLCQRVLQDFEKGLHIRFWKDAGTFRVKREVPHASPRGKILPLQIRR